MLQGKDKISVLWEIIDDLLDESVNWCWYYAHFKTMLNQLKDMQKDISRHIQIYEESIGEEDEK